MLRTFGTAFYIWIQDSKIFKICYHDLYENIMAYRSGIFFVCNSSNHKLNKLNKKVFNTRVGMTFSFNCNNDNEKRYLWKFK